MQNYVALLRGVNVGGKTMKMEALRSIFLELGFSNVRTYVQSGNVVFAAAKVSANQLSREIEERILREFSLPVSVIAKSSKEMEAIVKRNPLLKQKGVDESKLHVTFLAGTPKKAAAADLQSLAANGERFQILDQQIYLYCPNGYGRTKLSNNAIEKRLSVIATTRNWRTVNALLAMVAGKKGDQE